MSIRSLPLLASIVPTQRMTAHALETNGAWLPHVSRASLALQLGVFWVFGRNVVVTALSPRVRSHDAKASLVTTLCQSGVVPRFHHLRPLTNVDGASKVVEAEIHSTTCYRAETLNLCVL